MLQWTEIYVRFLVRQLPMHLVSFYTDQTFLVKSFKVYVTT